MCVPCFGFALGTLALKESTGVKEASTACNMHVLGLIVAAQAL